MLKVGIVGFPNVGKSTLFKALTNKSVDVSNYPFCTIEPNVGIVKVADKKLSALEKEFPRDKVIPAAIEFVDIAGLVKGASRGEGLGNKFLAQIREVDLILEVVRFFGNKDIIHIENRIDPKIDIETINTELILADLETVKNRLKKLEKEAKSQDKAILKELEAVKLAENCLEQEKFIKDCPINPINLKDLFLLTSKPILYLYNYSDKKVDLDGNLEKKEHLFLDAKIEEELSDLSKEEIKEMGIESQLNNLIKECFNFLGLITFFTMNEKEIRAWEVEKNTKIPQAGGKIHSDFEEKFIRAEVIQWDKLIELKSWHQAREKGILRTVGKDYAVEDGDVIYFLI
jgi:ribosome-binding ATPase